MEDESAYNQAIEKIGEYMIPGTRGTYSVKNGYILCGEFPIPKRGFSTSAEFWEIYLYDKSNGTPLL